jgi:hypothetical protein
VQASTQDIVLESTLVAVACSSPVSDSPSALILEPALFQGSESLDSQAPLGIRRLFKRKGMPAKKGEFAYACESPKLD